MTTTDHETQREMTVRYLKQKRYAEARTIAYNALAENSELSWPHVALGGIYANERRIDDALQSYAQAIHTDPTFDQAYVGLAGVLAQKGDFDQALQNIAHAKALNPNNPDIYWNEVGIYLSQRKFSPALNIAKEGLQRVKTFRFAILFLHVYLRKHAILWASIMIPVGLLGIFAFQQSIVGVVLITVFVVMNLARDIVEYYTARSKQSLLLSILALLIVCAVFIGLRTSSLSR